MTEFGPVPDPIQWHEGMLIGPHHFQQAWLRQDRLLDYRLGLLSPYAYGVVRLQFDHALLLTGVLRVTELEAVMPDGLLAVHPTDERAGDLEIQVKPLIPALQEGPMMVHVVVPRYGPGSCVEGGELARYRSVETPAVVDENTGDNGQPIPRVRPKLALHVGVPVPQKYVGMPIARIVYRNEQVQIDDYEPPRPYLPADSACLEACRLVARRLREKAAHLAQRLRAPPGSVGAAGLIESRFAIQCLVSGLPQLEAVLYAGRPHPFDLFKVMCGIAGHLAPLGAGLVPPIFEHYDHLDPNRPFASVLRFVLQMLDAVSEAYSTIAFIHDGHRFHLRMDKAWLERDLLVGVRLRSGQSEADVESWMAECLIASETLVTGLIGRRVRGARRQRVERDEDLEVVPGRGVLLYRIASDVQFVRPGEVLGIQHPADRTSTREPAEIVLYVPATSGGARGGAAG